MLLNYQKTARVHPFIRKKPIFRYITAEYSIPDDYEVEFIPQTVESESAGAVYSLRTNVSEDGRTINVLYSLQLKACNIPSGEYVQFRDFIKEHNNSVGASVVLKKKAE